MSALVLARDWPSIIRDLYERKHYQPARVSLEGMPEPRQFDKMKELGVATDNSFVRYGLDLADDLSFQVDHYVDTYVVQLIRKSEQAVAEHAEPAAAWNPLVEHPGIAIVVGVTAGATAGAMLGGSKGAAVGAIIAGATLLSAVSVSNAEVSPATSQAAERMFHGVTNSALGGPTIGRAALRPTPAPARPTVSRADRFDGADFDARRRQPGTKK